MDQMVSYYRIFIRSKIKNTQIIENSKKRHYGFIMDFRRDVAESLIRVNRPNTPSRKKGRPSAQLEQETEQINTKKK